MIYRIGHGYDVHRLVKKRDLIIGGVKIPYSKGLLGHSDADVLLHAIMDSILGAIGEKDIGVLFPDNKKEYENISSIELCKYISVIMQKKGYIICNIDATIIAQEPKLSPYIEEMKNNIAKVFIIAKDKINVKATTEEKLGFTGKKLGIAAHSVCLLHKE